MPATQLKPNPGKDHPSMQSHWDKIYKNAEIAKLGWYEEICTPSIELIKKSGISKNDSLFIAGAGASNLINWLVESEFHDIHVNDISPNALLTLQSHLKAGQEQIKWWQGDLLSDETLDDLGPVKLWHDRAVLHFFTKREDQEQYFERVNKMVAPGGFVIIGAFSKEGANFCSGLPVVNYSVEMLTAGIGRSFYLIDSFHYTHYAPSGEERPYIYTLFKRNRH